MRTPKWVSLTIWWRSPESDPIGTFHRNLAFCKRCRPIVQINTREISKKRTQLRDIGNAVEIVSYICVGKCSRVMSLRKRANGGVVTIGLTYELALVGHSRDLFS